MKRTFLGILFLLFAACYSNAKEYKLSSPDGKIIMTVTAGKNLEWSATFEGREIISSVKAGMVLGDSKVLGMNEIVMKAVTGLPGAPAWR